MFKITKPLDRLRQAYGLSALPDMIETEAFGELGQPIRKLITQATIDDIAFAIQALTEESNAATDRLYALRRLHDRARRAGGLGAELAIDVAIWVQETGR